MLTKLAVENYRSIKHLVIPLDSLNVISGENGSGKSNLYRALRLLSSAADDGVVSALAREGGMSSTIFAGGSGRRPPAGSDTTFEGTVSREPVRLRLGFAGTGFGYSIALGYPPPAETSAFSFDPEIKCEAIWAGELCRPATTLALRDRALLRVSERKEWRIVSKEMETFESMLARLVESDGAPEAVRLRESIRRWRFYDHLRTDADSPARMAHVGTRTTVLAHDGSDVAAAVQTIIEIGDREALHQTIEDAFPGARLSVGAGEDGRFALRFAQRGLLRALGAAELSDGTLRYILLVAALLTPRPPALMVLNEPETSLHPDLLPALGRLITRASEESQMCVVTHSTRLIATLEKASDCNSIVLEKHDGATTVAGQRPLDEPSWHWPKD